MRRGFGLVWALLTLAVVGVASWFAYYAGLAQGSATVTHDGSTAVPPPYYYHYGFGFGFFPFLFFILLLFLLFRRPWGSRRWGGYGRYGGGHWHGDGSQLPPPIEDRMKAWHEQVHGTQPIPESGAGQAPEGGGEKPGRTG